MNWFREGRRIAWPRVFLLVFAIAVAMSLGAGAAYTFGPFEPFNPVWEGTSEFRTAIVLDEDAPHHGEQLLTATRYEDIPGTGTVAFVIAPDRPYSSEDAAAVAHFVDRGGTLVLMDNFGNHTNPLLTDLGADARLDGHVLRDERFFYRGPTMPIATTVRNHSWTNDVDQLTLNVATAIEADNATMLIGTSETGYLGGLADEIDEEDDLQVYPVVTIERIGEGHVVLISDPSIAVNQMIDEPDNRAFLGALVDDADTVVYDLSHSGSVPPIQLVLITIRSTIVLQLVLGLVGIVLVILATFEGGRDRDVVTVLPHSLRARLPPWLYQGPVPDLGMTYEDRVAYVSAQYPEWTTEQVEHVVRGSEPADDDEATDNPVL